MPFTLPPVSNSASGKSGCVVRNTDNDGPAVGDSIVNAVRDSDADGVGTEVVVINQARRLAPAGAMILEVANEFALLGIHADDGRMSPAEAMTHVGNVVELEIAVCTGIRSTTS